MFKRAPGSAPGAGGQLQRRWGARRRAGAAYLAAALGLASLALPATALAAPSIPPTQTSTLAGPVTGYLQGDTGGSYAKYEFAYPGDGSVVQLQLTTDNAVPLDSGAAGVAVYQSGNLITSAGPNGPFTDLAIVSTDTAGPMTVEVFNYDPNNPVHFTLTPTGLPATTAGNATSSPAGTTGQANGSGQASMTLPLNGNVSGTLQGDSGGRFAIYQMAYPGDGTPVTLTLTTDRSAALDSGTFGINVYQGTALLTSAQQDSPLTATAIFTSSSNAPITIQVFNYAPSDVVAYTLTAQH